MSMVTNPPRRPRRRRCRADCTCSAASPVPIGGVAAPGSAQPRGLTAATGWLEVDQNLAGLVGDGSAAGGRMDGWMDGWMDSAPEDGCIRKTPTGCERQPLLMFTLPRESCSPARQARTSDTRARRAPSRTPASQQEGCVARVPLFCLGDVARVKAGDRFSAVTIDHGRAKVSGALRILAHRVAAAVSGVVDHGLFRVRQGGGQFMLSVDVRTPPCRSGRCCQGFD